MTVPNDNAICENCGKTYSNHYYSGTKDNFGFCVRDIGNGAKFSEKDTSSRRLKIIRMSRDYLIFPFKQKGMFYIMTDKNRLPKDTQVIGIEFNASYDTFNILIQSNEFPAIPEGAEVPEIAEIDSPVFTMNPLDKKEDFEKAFSAFVVKG